jgi:hypothetical protein
MRVRLVTDVRRANGDELVVVAELAHRGQPDVEQLPGGGLDDVFDEHHLVAVHFGRSDDVPEGRAGAVQGAGGDVAGRFE